MSGFQVEVETKLDLPGGAVDLTLAGLPFRDLPGVQAVEEVEPLSMVAEYHDTTDLTLLRDGVTLRRRTGGADEGWHLKLPLADGSRLEQHEPLGKAAGAVPVRLVDLSRSRHRDQPLVPVATLTTRRRALLLRDEGGQVLAEVADDTVTAVITPTGTAGSAPNERQSWRELEVELLGGPSTLLTAAVRLLHDAGAAPAGHGSKLRRALDTADAWAEHPPPARPGGAAGVLLTAVAEHVATLVASDPAVRLDQPDAVHTMRVAARRLRSLLVAFRPWLQPGPSEALRDELRWLGRVLGGPRDAEVLRARIDRRLAQLPADSPQHGPQDDAQQRPSKSRVWPDQRPDVGTAAAVGALDGARYLAMLGDLDRFLQEPPLGPSGGRRKGTRRAARRAYRRVVRMLEEVPAQPGPAQDGALHEVRKAAKRLRYTGEAVAGVHGRAAARLAARAEDLQELLGEHQDSVLAREVLRGASGRTSDVGESFLLGTLAGLELAAAAEAIQDLDRTVRRLHRAAGRWFGKDVS